MVDSIHLGCLLCRWHTCLFVHYGRDSCRIGCLGDPELCYGSSEQIVGI